MMGGYIALSRLLRAGIAAGLALMLLGVLTGSPLLGDAGVAVLILTPASGLLVAAAILKEEGAAGYAAAALIDSAVIVGTLLYYSIRI